MSKLNSLLEATRGSDKKDTSDLQQAQGPKTPRPTIGCVQILFLDGETRPRTEVFKSHHIKHKQEYVNSLIAFHFRDKGICKA